MSLLVALEAEEEKRIRTISLRLVEVFVYSSAAAAEEEVSRKKKKKKVMMIKCRQGPDSLKPLTRSAAERRERRPCRSSAAVINCAEQGDFKG